LRPSRSPKVQAIVRELQDLAAVHFAKEEQIFYPKLRPFAADLLTSLDLQHEEVRELERHVAELLADTPPVPPSRWLNEHQ
jgi:hypothetical protein